MLGAVTAGAPELTGARFFTAWDADPVMLAIVLVLAAGYLAGVRRLARRGERWPIGRTATFLLGGLGTWVVATMSSLQVYHRTLFWTAATQVTVLLMITPIGLALGDPVGLVRRAAPTRGAALVDRALHSAPARALFLPIVSTALAAVTQLAVFFTPYLAASLHSTAVHELILLQLVVTGCLFALPMLGEELLPAWCTQPVRAAIAFVDGLLDAVPGILVMTSTGLLAGGFYGRHPRSWGPTPQWDQTIGGGLMLTLAEAVGLPFLAGVFVQWYRDDERQAAALDRRLDLAAERAISAGTAAGAVDAGRDVLTAPERAGDDRTYPQPPVLDRPWWEVDPGPLRDRVRQRGWDADGRSGSRG